MAGSSANLSASITMTDGASAVLRQVRGEIEKTNASTSKHGVTAEKLGYSWGKAALAMGGATIGLAAITRALKDSITAAAEDDKAVQSLNRAMLNVGHAFGNADVQSWVDSLSLATGVTDDLIRNGLRTLITATGDVEKSQKAMGLAMDIAAGTGKDLQSVSTALAKGYGGQTTALGRLGVGLDKATLASGDMDKITAALSSKFKGQAQTAADSYAGRLSKLSVAANEASEAVGYALLDSISAISDKLGGEGGAAGVITELGDGLALIVRDSGEAAAGLTELVKALAGGEGPTASWAEETFTLGNAINAAATAASNMIMGPAGQLFKHFADSGTAADGAATASNRYQLTMQAQAAAARDASEANEDVAEKTDDVAVAAFTAEARVRSFKDALDQLNSGNRDLIESESQFRAAIDELATTFDGTTTPAVNRARDAFNLHKESGRKAAEALNTVAESATEAAEAAADEGKWGKANRLLDTARDKIIDQAREWGLSKDAAKRYADQILAIPTTVTTTAYLNTISQYRPMHSATGGPVVGPGTGTSDSVPAMLSNGEYVVRAATVNKVGRGFLDALNSGRLFGFASGGGVQTFNNNPRGSNVKQAGYNYMTQMTLGRPASTNPPLSNGDKGNVDSNYFRQLADTAGNAADAADAAARAAEELARAEAARLAEIRRQQQELIGQARQLMIEAGRTRDDFARGVAQASIGFGSITGFDSSGSDWAALSMRAPGSSGAGGPASSGGSIGDFMAGRLTRVKTFGDVLKRLASAGLNSSTLREIVSAGPDEGTTLGQALLEAGVSEIGRVNSIQASLEDTSGDIGAFAGNAFYAGAVRDAAGNYTRVVGANGGVDDTPIQVNLLLDGQTVVTQLLAIKRDRGGVSLGLG